MHSQCGSSCGCADDCTTEKGLEKRILDVDFLYLALDECGRCKSTCAALDEAISEARLVLSPTGVEIRLKKTLVKTRQQAIAARFATSPSIRINGKDIAPTFSESGCKECGDLCGDNVDCRVWHYNGKQYLTPPKSLLIDAILSALQAPILQDEILRPFVLPDNLERFFKGTERDKSKL